MPEESVNTNAERTTEHQFSLGQLIWFPLLTFAAMERRSFPAFVSEVFSLSPSLVRRGRPLRLRQSTQDRALRHVIARAERLLGGTAEPRWQRFQDFLQASPGRQSQEPRPFADLTHLFAASSELPLPLATEQAIRIDRFLMAAIDAYQRDDLAAFKALFDAYDWRFPAKAGESPTQRENERRVRFSNATSWEEALGAARGYDEQLLLGWLAAVDAEFGALYFKKLKPRPLSLLVAPRFKPGLDFKTAKPFSQRNALLRPQRRILEFCYAILYWPLHEKWPQKAPGRSQLGSALGLSDGNVGNLFDGTAKLRLKDLLGKWMAMSLALGYERCFKPPWVLMAIAVLMEHTLIDHRNGKLESVNLIDAVEYRRLWQWHRDQWAKQLPPAGTAPWPNWLSDQLSSSSL